MKIIREGHKYELENFEHPEKIGQAIQFIEKAPETPPVWEMQSIGNGLAVQGKSSPPLVTVHDGTTNEDVLSVLIDRMNYLQAKFPCRENAIVITKLEECLMWLNKRTEDRKKRNVEGKHLS